MTSEWARTTVLVLGAFVCSHCLAQEPAESNRQVITRVTPQYPSLARGIKLQGTGRVEAMVGPDGSPKAVEIKGGHPLFAQAARDAVQKWKWAPAPKQTLELIEVKFNP
jgi:TonB family protein